MAKLEGVVRPFAGRNVMPQPIDQSANAAISQNVLLNPGKNGSGKTMTGSYSFSEKWYATAKEKEVKNTQ